MKFDGIEGDVTHKGYEKWIELVAWSWGVSNSSTVGGGAGKVSFQDIHFVAPLVKGSPTLFKNCCTGLIVPKVVLAIYDERQDPGPLEYYRLTLENVLVSSMQFGSSSGELPPMALSISLNFTKIEYLVRFRNQIGQILIQKASWDLQAAA